MSRDDENSVLLIHHRDITTPFGTTVPYYLADRLADRHSVHVVCRKRSAERNGDEADLDAVVHDVNTGDLPVVSALLFHLVTMAYAPLIALAHRIDVAYSFQTCLAQGWLCSRVGPCDFRIGLQSVPVRQGDDFDYYGGCLQDRAARSLLSGYAAVVRSLIDRSSAVLCLTAGIAEKTEEMYGVDLSDAPVLGMGVDVEKFSLPRRVDGGERQHQSWMLTYLGTVAESRGFEHVLQALSATEADVTLQIAGSGADGYTERLQAEAERLDVAEQVEWLGLVPHDEVPSLLAKTDFTLSPLPDIESYRISFPAKLLEYMAAETVVIASDIPPHRNLIDHGENGYLYDGSASGLTEVLSRCTRDDHDLHEIQRRARETAEAYDWDVVLQQYEDAIFAD